MSKEFQYTPFIEYSCACIQDFPWNNSKELTGMQCASNLGWIDPFDPGSSLKSSGNALNQDKYETLGICDPSVFNITTSEWKIFTFLYYSAEHNPTSDMSGLIRLQGLQGATAEEWFDYRGHNQKV